MVFVHSKRVVVYPHVMPHIVTRLEHYKRDWRHELSRLVVSIMDIWIQSLATKPQRCPQNATKWGPNPERIRVFWITPTKHPLAAQNQTRNETEKNKMKKKERKNKRILMLKCWGPNQPNKSLFMSLPIMETRKWAERPSKETRHTCSGFVSCRTRGSNSSILGRNSKAQGEISSTFCDLQLACRAGSSYY